MSHVKELPHDFLAEKSFVGCLIIDGTSINEVSDLSLVKEDFYHPQYGLIFECVRELSIENMPIDYVTVCSKLSDKGQLEMTGGQATILEIVEDQASAANIYQYAKIVKDKSIMRNIIRTAMKVADTGMSFSGDTQDFISDVEAQFFKLTSKARVGGMRMLNNCLKDNLKSLAAPARKNGEIEGISSGYPELDRYLLGMQPGQLIVLAARPGMGKTSLAVNIAVSACEHSAAPVAIFSLEMLARELSMRMLSSRAKIDSTKLRTKNFLDTDLRNINNSVSELSKFPIFINDSGATTIIDIQGHCRKIKAERGLGLVVIDYLQLLRPHSNNPNREQQISEMSRGLKSLAKELECPILALSQLNRGVESRTEKRPLISDLRESGSIEQDADIVIMIYRDDFYDKNSKDPGVAEIIVCKNRSGENGTAKLAWVGRYTSFEQLSNDSKYNNDSQQFTRN